MTNVKRIFHMIEYQVLKWVILYVTTVIFTMRSQKSKLRNLKSVGSAALP